MGASRTLPSTEAKALRVEVASTKVTANVPTMGADRSTGSALPSALLLPAMSVEPPLPLLPPELCVVAADSSFAEQPNAEPPSNVVSARSKPALILP
jgi:hypothetical protein